MTDWAVFESLEPEERADLLRAGRTRSYARGEVIVRVGDPAACLHLLEQGRVSVRLPTLGGDQMIVSVLGPGSVIGEQSTLDEESEWSVSVVAQEACTTISIRRSQVREILHQHPAVIAYLLAGLDQQYRLVCERLVEMTFVSTSRRVQRRLLELHTAFDSSVITVTQSDVASMAGATRTTVNSILRGLERRGVVRNGRGQLEVLDVPALMRGAARTS